MHIKHVQINVFYLGALKNVFLIVLALLLLVNDTIGLRCYVCGSEENQSDCDKFKENENVYAKECPPNSLGCSTQTKGNTIIIRACEDYQIDDCRIANGIEYCYCSSDLCNGNQSIKKSIPISSIGLEDDEDLIEGSGYNRIFSISDTTVTKVQTTEQPPNNANCLHGTIIIYIAASSLFI